MKMKSVLLLVLIAFTSCATLFKGGNEEVSFSSNPDSAKVYVNGQYMGDTPLQLKLKSSDTYTIELRKEGYVNKTIILNNKIGVHWIVLDILAGLVPIIVDAATGDWMQLESNNITGVLEASL